MPKERHPREKDPCFATAAIGVIVNLLLMAGKIVIGILSGSSALLSDGIHSASDVAAGGVVLLGVALSHRAKTRGRLRAAKAAESATAIVIALFLLFSVALILIGAIPALLRGAGEGGEAELSLLLPLAIAALSVLLKSAMAWHCKRVARRSGSIALLADARHHKSDAITSAGTAAGIGGALLGVPVLDPLTSILISLLILRTAVSILLDMKKTDRL